MAVAPDLERRVAQFVPVAIDVDLSSLSVSDRAVLEELVAASRHMGEIFRRQASRSNPAMRERIAASGNATLLTYFDHMVGPWDRLDDKAFVGDLERPEGAGYYPTDMTREEYDAWLVAHPGDREAFESLYTLIERQDGGLVAVPYRVAFAQWLDPAAAHLEKAAALTDEPTLARFLKSRAAAFRSDDYYVSDKDWMDLEGIVDVTIGPYEVYEDRMFGNKAAYESFVTVVSPEISRTLTAYKSELPGMELALPIPDALKNKNRGTESPIRVADIVFTAGDTRAGVQTIAFNLPNDERVREEKGSKKVILRNVMDAKYRKIMEPIARRVIHPSQHHLLDPTAFFNETLFHELSHGLGPGKIVIDGRETEVRKELEELYSASEECKADVMGAYNVLYMIDRGTFATEYREPFLVTYFAGLFRSVRFGTGEAHGLGAAVQISWFLEKGGATFDPPTGTFRVDTIRLEELITSLTRRLCVLQARGDKEGTARLLDHYGGLGDSVGKTLERLSDLPVDIRPVYPAAGERL